MTQMTQNEFRTDSRLYAVKTVGYYKNSTEHGDNNFIYDSVCHNSADRNFIIV